MYCNHTVWGHLSTITSFQSRAMMVMVITILTRSLSSKIPRHLAGLHSVKGTQSLLVNPRNPCQQHLWRPRPCATSLLAACQVHVRKHLYGSQWLKIGNVCHHWRFVFSKYDFWGSQGWITQAIQYHCHLVHSSGWQSHRKHVFLWRSLWLGLPCTATPRERARWSWAT